MRFQREERSHSFFKDLILQYHVKSKNLGFSCLKFGVNLITIFLLQWYSHSTNGNSVKKIKDPWSHPRQRFLQYRHIFLPCLLSLPQGLTLLPFFFVSRNHNKMRRLLHGTCNSIICQPQKIKGATSVSRKQFFSSHR